MLNYTRGRDGFGLLCVCPWSARSFDGLLFRAPHHTWLDQVAPTRFSAVLRGLLRVYPGYYFLITTDQAPGRDDCSRQPNWTVVERFHIFQHAGKKKTISHCMIVVVAGAHDSALSRASSPEDVDVGKARAYDSNTRATHARYGSDERRPQHPIMRRTAQHSTVQSFIIEPT